jgi:hypothetical protein
MKLVLLELEFPGIIDGSILPASIFPILDDSCTTDDQL